MINGFESLTAPLTDYEKDVILPKMIIGLEIRIGEENAVTAKQMTAGLARFGIKCNGPRVRKIINYIRMTGAVKNLIASSKGYWVEPDQERVAEYAQSFMHRAEVNIALANAVLGKN